MNGVSEISGAPRYDDLIAERYHCPRTYLRAEAWLGDCIVYRETGGAGGRKAYVATGLVHCIDPDPADRTHRADGAGRPRRGRRPALR
jgi:putative restriction endonuclease